MPFCKNDSTRKYKGDEPSPKGLGFCAHADKEELIKKGNDGNIWKVKKDKNGTKRWVKNVSKILNYKNFGMYKHKKKETLVGINGPTNKLFYPWNFGTINIRTGNEKSEGYRLYMITKEVARAKLQFCSLQEVRYRNNGRKVISLDTGESYVFLWCGQKKRRDAGVGILIKQCNKITFDDPFDDPDITDPRIMAMNIQIRGFNIRLVNVYAPTNCD